MKNHRENISVKKSFGFALGIVELSKQLFPQKRFSLVNQIFKSATSIGANA